MKPANACYQCADRHPGCHADCQKYADFLKHKDDLNEQRKRIDSDVYAAYARQRKYAKMDDAAKSGFRKPNSQKTRYH